MDSSTARFIGREQELSLLRAALRRAASGRATLIEVAAEAGFGKTRLISESVRHLGPDARVIHVPSFEDDHRPAALLSRLHAALPSLAPSNLAAVTARGLSPVDPTELGVDTTAKLSDVLDDGFVVVVLEDIHWADPPSVEALLALTTGVAQRGSESEQTRLALVVSYRPFELSDSCRALLGRLGAYLGGACRVQPRPLEPLEINAFVIALGHPRPSGRLLTALVDVSAGNPLHVQTVMDQLDRTGRLRRIDGITDYVGRQLPTDFGHGLVGAIEQRLKLLDTEDRQLLGLVALLDPPVAPETIAEVARLSWKVVLERLESPRTEQLIDVDESVVVFKHPLLRSVLTRLLPPGQRAEIEARIAAALTAEDDATVVSAARHLGRAGPFAPPEVVADTCARAARVAFERGDYAGGAQLAEDALAAAEKVPGRWSTVQLGRLHLLTAIAHFRNHDRAAWRPHADAARAAGQGAGDLELWCDAELLATRARMTFGPHPVEDEPLIRLRDRLRPEDEALRGRIDEELAEVSFGAGRYAEGEVLALHALTTAERSGDQGDESMAHFALGLNTWAMLRLSEARASFETCGRLAAVASDRWLTTWGPGRLSLVARMEGRFDEVLRSTADNAARAEALGDWSELALASALRTSVHAAQGQAGLAEQEGARGLALEARGDYVWAPTILLPALAGLRAERGDAMGAADALDRYASVGRPAPRPLRQLVALALDDEAALRSQFVPRRLRAAVDALTLVGFCAYAGAAARLGERQAAEWAVEDLLPVAEQGVLMPVGWNVLLPRLLGAAFRCCGEDGQARRWLERAVERATLCGAMPELGRTWAELAVLHARPHPDADRDEGRRCVARAVSIARRYGLGPLERSVTDLGLTLGRFDGDADLLRQAEDEVASPLVGAIVFTDIVDSTRRSRAARDAGWIKVLSEHDRRLRACLARFGGTEFAYTGDGLAAFFASANDAVGCAAAFHDTLRSLESLGGAGLPIRVGVCWGEATPRGHDLAGSTISRTVRVMAIAAGGQTVVDTAVRAATCRDWAWQSLGTPPLKGFEDEPHEVYLLQRRSVP